MNRKSGFVAIPREVLKLSFWDDPWDVTLWFYCALRATHQKIGNLDEGQLFTSKQIIAHDLGWSRNGLKKHLDSLEEKGFINAINDGRGLRITLLHWRFMTNTASSDRSKHSSENAVSSFEQRMSSFDTSGHFDTECGHAVNVNGQNMTSNGQTLTLPWSQDDHEQYKQTQDNNLSRSEREKDFEVWWNAYPRHENKSAARAAFLALDIPVASLLAAVEAAKQSRQWQSQNGRFIPSAAKWLDGPWQDYLPVEATPRKDKREWTTY